MEISQRVNPNLSQRHQQLLDLASSDPNQFWAQQAEKYLDWYKPWHKVNNCDFSQGKIRWFEGATLNASYNCLDRHLNTRSNQVAIIWEGNEPGQTKYLSYQYLHEQVSRFANVLKAQGINKGDRVCLYLPMIPELVIGMLACARIGAVHSVVFGGFSPESLAKRIIDAKCKLIITADEGLRGDKIISLKQNVDRALKQSNEVEHVIVVKRTGNAIYWENGRDLWYHECITEVDSNCKAEELEAEHPLFILYTSGSTGKPKGVLHTTAGYLLYSAFTFNKVFNHQDGDLFWCSADIGWITGHSYITYAPLVNGATMLMYEGIPFHPTPNRVWEIIDQHQVNIFYTAPTLIRMLKAEGDQYPQKASLKSLKVLGSVGEPINPDVWQWFYQIVGHGNCPIVDTWFQTETGAIMISSLANTTEVIPGCATKSMYTINFSLLDDSGKIIEGPGIGNLVINNSWPGQLRTVYGDHNRFMSTYFERFPGYYFTGDLAKRDAHGNFWILGRTDDVINVSGHRIGTAEIESALVAHKAVNEAAVVGIPHKLKGEGIFAFVSINASIKKEQEVELKQALLSQVDHYIGKFSRPESIVLAPDLPKTRSGKIMRRILKKIASGEQDFGDTSTLANPNIIEQLLL